MILVSRVSYCGYGDGCPWPGTDNSTDLIKYVQGLKVGFKEVKVTHTTEDERKDCHW